MFVYDGLFWCIWGLWVRCCGWLFAVVVVYFLCFDLWVCVAGVAAGFVLFGLLLDSCFGIWCWVTLVFGVACFMVALFGDCLCFIWLVIGVYFGFV